MVKFVVLALEYSPPLEVPLDLNFESNEMCKSSLQNFEE
jgi:hypothetical protein